MGVWVEEKRHGSGVVVTQHSVYYEGTFRDDKMSVSLNMRRRPEHGRIRRSSRGTPASLVSSGRALVC